MGNIIISSIVFWYNNYFLTFSTLQELTKERNLVITQSDFNKLERYCYKKNLQKSFLNKTDLISDLIIKKVEKKIKDTWLYLYIDSNKKVHDFYFNKNDDLDKIREFFNNSLASNGLPHKINSYMAEKEKIIKSKFDIIKNNRDIDFF
ncbi:hypothetical protein [Legionella cardiaca]|uniref:Uncharacterized protein n=1 Tax=Legionella cardiaca TaxID=1071983 RepID=A0ABY8AN95_9GAMM|nr:hypothetical protein [Legionella cardiaca]WED42038.1 hypothetical protein PXX05_08840 [Legionella cardiaca]